MSTMKRKFRGDGFAAAEALYGKSRKDRNGQYNLDLSGETIHNNADIEPPVPIFVLKDPIYSEMGTSLDSKNRTSNGSEGK